MLTSAGRRGDGARCREFGIQAYLTKPVKRAELLATIRTVFGLSETHDENPDGSDLVTRHYLRENRTQLRVLVAEDNVVNQKLAVRLLEKWGHEVDVVGDGRQAVNLLRTGDFDAVLMDLQMPEMGGLEATRLIREWESEGSKRTPIIGLTAHAMQEDRDRCLEAGMDDYITKPIRADKLRQTLDAIAEAGRTSGEEDAASAC
jgi:CheY-like chemotaxis protein